MAAYAAAPSGGYLPNATLDPDCAPWDTDCFVQIAVDQDPWFGTDDNMSATDNSENIYQLGNVWIWTVSPAAKLDVFGWIKADGISNNLNWSLILAASNGKNSILSWRKWDSWATGRRWTMNLWNSVSETWWNIWSDLNIYRHDDSGDIIENTIYADRETWNIAFWWAVSNDASVYMYSNDPDNLKALDIRFQWPFTTGESNGNFQIIRWPDLGSADNSIQLNASANNSLSFWTSWNTDQMVIRKSGKVGIGSINPSTVLEVWSDVPSASGNDNLLFLNSNDNVSGMAMADNLGSVKLDTVNGVMRFYTGGSANTFAVTASEAMRITSAGNVGIGNTTANKKLHVSGWVNDVARFDIAWWVSGHPQLYLEPTANVSWAAFNIEARRAWIDANAPLSINGLGGKVGIGTITPAEELHVEWDGIISRLDSNKGDATSLSSHMRFFRSWIGLDPASATTYFRLDSNGDGAWWVNKLQFWYLGTGWYSSVLSMVSSWNVGIGTTIPAEKLTVSGNILATWTITPSDRKLKDNIVEIENALDKVNSIGGYTYTLKETGEAKAGVIAQEIEAVLPEAVNTYEDYKAVEYDMLNALLIEAVQELSAENSDLKSQVQELHEKMEIVLQK